MSGKLVLWLCCVVFGASAFNFSPRPNVVIREPNLKTFMPKVRSSYFGFTINLRYQSVIVGAPRAQSTLEKQRKVNETGAIYKCSAQTGMCTPFVFDDIGNTYIENSEYTYDSEKKDNQWLGAAMDGGPKDTDRLVVCAPRRLADLPNDYLVHGICYWTTDTTGDRPLNVRKISPLRLIKKQIKEVPHRRYFYYMFGEQGLSAHITENNEEIIIGAPGIHTWKGSIIRYYGKIQEDMGGLSRRDNRANTSIRPKRATIEYVSEVPNPDLWNQNNDSYFGYSVSSNFFMEHGMKKLMYIATAPQANQQSGEAYLFDLIKMSDEDPSIRKSHVFRGSQFGEYFGYSVISDDINGDGLPDVIISAPQYAVGLNYEKGAVYVFINKGNLNFDSGKLIVGQSDKPGRFGTTLSKLGDINHDGYNDIAIGAPFEENGVVYIYLGNEKGLREKPSQILKAPQINTVYESFMFGHGLSKGVDIDQNGFNDIAIGAPNAEAVLIYKSYPVVKIVASITSPSRAISLDQTKFQVRACYELETTSSKINDQIIAFRITADAQVNRVKFSSGSNEIRFNNTVTSKSQCQLLDANVKSSLLDIFKPIELEMSYEVLNKIPDSESFCETCVAVDPSDPTAVSQKIVFSTGCKTDICVADLQLASSGVKSPYTLGSSRTITVQYEVTNQGETAYLPQINITSTNHMPFAKIPSSCIQDSFTLLCDLYQGRPMTKGNKDILTVVFDTTDVTGERMSIIAKTFSAGMERTSHDNEVVDIIILEEFSEIESAGRPITRPLNLEENSKMATIENLFEIRNNGPSKVTQMDIVISIPISYLIPQSENRIPLIDFSNITINATYNNKALEVEFYQNNSMLIQNPIEISSTPPAIVSNFREGSLDSSMVKYPLEEDSIDELFNSHVMARRRRALEVQATEAEYARISQKTVATQFSDDLVGTLPINRTILFNCNNPEETLCVQAVLRVYNLQSKESVVRISVQYNVDLKEIDKILLEPKEFFVITTSLNVSKIGDEESKTFILKKTDPHNIISKHQLYSTPIWVYVLSILGGILLLVLITYGLYRLGFFRRQKKEELQKLYRQSQQQASDETEDEE